MIRRRTGRRHEREHDRDRRVEEEHLGQGVAGFYGRYRQSGSRFETAAGPADGSTTPGSGMMVCLITSGTITVAWAVVLWTIGRKGNA
ncbi:hypothetical protein ACFWN5_39830 [Streptomyces sp. NPDC058430]|uniref:hypothetical protein n=1 Tax=Streptomyces sp. NPDC058430 TaxID=3346495 RepID=UPI00364ED0E0